MINTESKLSSHGCHKPNEMLVVKYIMKVK